MPIHIRLLEYARRNLSAVVFVALVVLLLASRVPHLRGPIDDPHSWRQCDTAQYAQSFYEDGINLAAPSVCWMGNHKALILEFPFPEAIMALAYKAFGPDLMFARLVTLLFFTGSAFYLYLIVHRLAHARLAILSTTIYCVLPLALFYSRAIHVDFAAVCFAHAMTFHLLRCFERRRVPDLLLAIAAAILAFLIKAPYAFYFVLPLFIVALQNHWRSSLAILGTCMGIGVAAFLVWRHHANAVNAAAPDWNFIPTFMKFVNMDAWYYGPLAMRWDPQVWATIAVRLADNVATKPGIVLAFAGLAVSAALAFRGHLRRVLPLWAWTVGLLVYVLVFLNLNYVHDYYQIPFVALFAVLIALAVDAPFRFFDKSNRLPAALLSLALFAGVGVASVCHAEKNFYTPDIIRQSAAEIIARATPADALCIIAVDSRGTGFPDPRILFRAGRMGWSLNTRGLTPDIIAKLKAEGATHIALISKRTELLTGQLNLAATTHELAEPNWKVAITEL